MLSLKKWKCDYAWQPCKYTGLYKFNYILSCGLATEFKLFGLNGSLAEIEKIYGIAINGSEEEKISAATVLCGATLTRGWNIQVITYHPYEFVFPF